MKIILTIPGKCSIILDLGRRDKQCSYIIYVVYFYATEESIIYGDITQIKKKTL